MNKQEALNIIIQVCSVYKGTLQEHQAIQEALKTINELLELNDKNKEEAGETEEKKEN